MNLLRENILSNQSSNQKIFSSKCYDMSPAVSISSEFSEIESYALSNQDNLILVNISGNVKKIGERAFENSQNLRKIILHEGLEEIGKCAFNGCISLNKIIIPDSVKKIHLCAFSGYGCSELAEPIYNASKTILYYVPPSTSTKIFSVPNGVKTISSKAFQACKNITRIILPDSLEKIETMAFTDCKISKIDIPSNVKIIESRAFWCCEKLKLVNLLCDPDILAANTFYKFDPPLRIISDKLTRYRYLRAIGCNLCYSHLENINIPQAHIHDSEFIFLSQQSREGNTSTMLNLSSYFDKLYENYQEKFYKLAANFWHYFACEKGNKDAEKWVNAWLNENPNKAIETAISVPICGNYRGDVLQALGFNFFKPDRDYYIDMPDSEGVVEVTSYLEEDGPDENGFGREIYYDWWYLSDCLKEFPGTKCIHSYSTIDKRANKKLFQEMHDIVVKKKNLETQI